MAPTATHTKIVRDDSIGIDRRVVAGQPIPPDLVEAYETAGGEASPIPSQTGAVIAQRTVDVEDPVLDINRRVIAGTPVPPDLVEAYKAKVGDTDDEPAEPAEEAAAEDDGDTSGETPEAEEPEPTEAEPTPAQRRGGRRRSSGS